MKETEFIKIKTLLKEGGIFAYPTETVYGLGADPYSRTAVEKVLALKGRSLHQTPLLLIPDREWLPKLTKRVSPVAERLMDLFWPGPLTLIFEASRDIPSWLLRDNETIALRISSHAWVKSFIQFYGEPLISTSANPSGKESALSLDKVHAYFGPELLCVDGGVLSGSHGSTIVAIEGDNVRILRKGELSEDEIRSKVRDE